MKKLVYTAAFGLAFVCSLIISTQSQARELRIGTISAAGSPWDKAMQRFSDVLSEESGGDLTAVVYTDGQLGDIQQMLTGMQLGNVEMGYFGLGSALFLKGSGPLKVIYSPYLFRDRAHAQKALNNDVFRKIYDDIAKTTGVRIVGAWGNRSPRAIQTTKGPIKKPEDLKGLKMRVPGIDLFQEEFKALGVQTVPMSMTEIYTGLSKGLVEGQDNGFDLALPLKFHEVAKYWSATDHSYETTGWFISEQLWQSLSPKDQAAITKAAEAGGEVTSAEELKLEQEAKQIFKNAGVTYTVPDRDAFREALRGIPAKFEGTVWPEGFIAKIQAIK
ncbi:TRAP transporter substrate-binding protein [Hwanghaeella sp. LZ110]|uniref:TRAP transporter substrate-binding protein n=1 Tax=Hwanghaeella sp. LZ110 TaxID=3402810 RepID=UPI003B679458